MLVQSTKALKGGNHSAFLADLVHPTEPVDMKHIGICVSREDCTLLREQVADYLEIKIDGYWQSAGFNSLAWKADAHMWAQNGMPVMAINRLFPAEMNLFETPESQLYDYLTTVFNAAHEQRVTRVVLGSGHARKYPASWRSERASQHFSHLLTSWVPLIESNQIELLIEPLSPYETNLINSLEEGQEMLESLGHSSLGLVYDPVHSLPEETRQLHKFRHWLRHAHISEPPNRRVPQSAQMGKLLELLSEMSKVDMVTLECSWKSLSVDAQHGVAFVRTHLQHGA